MECLNAQFGKLEYEDRHVVEFPEGIIGFEALKKYLIIRDEDSLPFRWLVSLEDCEFTLPLIEPSLVFPAYKVPQELPTEASVYVVAVMREPIEESTTNLKSPIIVDNKGGMGKQIILDSEKFPLHHPIFPAANVEIGG